MGWSDELDRWTSWLRAAGRPVTTVALRRYHLERVARELTVDPWVLTVDQLVGWLGSHNWSPETRRSYRASLRSFYGWAQATGRRTDSPAHLLPPVQVPRGRPRPTPDDAYRIALACSDPRSRLIVQLAAACGLRRGEIARIHTSDLETDLLGWCLRVTGKGGHVRSVPLPDALATQIAAAPRGYLFPSNRSTDGHLTPHHVGVIVSRLLPQGWACHTLRHRCATTAYAATKDLRAVQELLGHAKPETTARYTQIPQEAVRAAMNMAAAAA